MKKGRQARPSLFSLIRGDNDKPNKKKNKRSSEASVVAMARTMTFGTSQKPTKKPLNGYFSNGQWHCNCQPREAAIQFQVKRDSPNKGRWFYTCPKDRTKGRPGAPEKCDFFLWAEEAREREEARAGPSTPARPRYTQTTLVQAVTPRAEPRDTLTGLTPINKLPGMSGGGGATRGGLSAAVDANEETNAGDSLYGSDLSSDDEGVNETELVRAADRVRAPQTPASTSKGRLGGAALPTPASTAAVGAGAKRKRSDEGDEFGGLSSDEERQLAALTDSTSKSLGMQRAIYSTPANPNRTHDIVGGMTTPSLTDKPVRRVLFAEPLVQAQSPATSATTSKRQRTDEAGNFATPARPPPSTPSSSSSSSGSQPRTPGSESASTLLSITTEVMGLLQGQNIDSHTLSQVREALQRHDARARGMERGRDATRRTIQQKEDQIAQLQERIVDLENQRSVLLVANKKLKRGLMTLYSDN